MAAQLQGAARFTMASTLLLVAWIVLTFDGLYSAVGIWWENEIFNHCLLILPAVCYLIYLKRYKLANRELTTDASALVLILPALLVYAVGALGNVHLLMHVAAFSLLPLLIWFSIGFKSALQIFFPLCFILFAVPVGEELVPYLQEITADGSVALLQLSGIPLYRSGLYIEIPQGRFLVAEACSGVSFFIASLVIGSLYAYLNFVSRTKRIGFFIIALILPVVANIFRVFGIIVIAYLTDMEYAAGADHLIYGWFFFAFVLICLLMIGEFMRDKDAEWEAPAPEEPVFHFRTSIPLTLVTVGLLLGTAGWLYKLDNTSYPVALSGQHSQSTDSACTQPYTWQAQLRNPSVESYQRSAENGACVTHYRASFDEITGELISGRHRLYSDVRWTLLSSGTLSVTLAGEQRNLPLQTLVAADGTQLYLTYFYTLGDRILTNGVKVKFSQIWRKLLGDSPVGVMHIYVSDDPDVMQPAIRGSKRNDNN